MNDSQKVKYAATLSRLTLGGIMLAHSIYLKFWVFGLPGTASYFVSIGLPALLAYVVFLGEFIAGLSLIVGHKVKFASLLLVPILLGATWAHWEAGWLFSNQGGGWEYPFVLTVMAVNQFLIGEGLPLFQSERE